MFIAGKIALKIQDADNGMAAAKHGRHQVETGYTKIQSMPNIPCQGSA